MSCFFLVFFAALLAVPDLKGEEFNRFISQNPSAHILFAAPWCGHCKQFKPVFYQVAKMATEIKFAEVDCTTEQAICEKYDVKGYPTIKYFKDGRLSQDYQGERTAPAFHDYVLDLSRPLMTLVEQIGEFETISADNSSASLFGFFCKNDDLYEPFKTAAESPLRKVMRFYYTRTHVICQAGSQDSTVVMFGGSQGYSIYSGDLDLYEWTRDSYLGPCGRLTPQTESLFTQPTLVAYFSVDYANNKKYSDYYRKRMAKVMEQNGYSLMCGYADIDAHVESLNLDKTERIGVFIHESNRKYKMEAAFSVQSVAQFVEDYLSGKLKPSVKSAPLPSPNPVAGLYELVGLNFEEVVNQPKGVFILFYAPWCGHCKNVLPVYEQLANQFENHDKLLIAKIDATANDFPADYEVTGFPTFYYSPVDSKESPVKYQGSRDLNSFVAFLNSVEVNGGTDSADL